VLLLAAILSVSIFNERVTAQDFELVSGFENDALGMIESDLSLRIILNLGYLFLSFYTAIFIFLPISVRKKDQKLYYISKYTILTYDKINLLFIS